MGNVRFELQINGVLNKKTAYHRPLKSLQFVISRPHLQVLLLDIMMKPKVQKRYVRGNRVEASCFQLPQSVAPVGGGQSEVVKGARHDPQRFAVQHELVSDNSDVPSDFSFFPFYYCLLNKV